MPEQQRQSSKLPKLGSFDAHKNAAASIILSHSEIDMEISDTDMETAESNDCREISKDNRDTNSVLAMI